MYPADTAEALPGPDWLRKQRSEAVARSAGLALPTFELEEWRYSPIDDLRPDAYRPATQPPTDVDAAPFTLDGAASSVVTIDGFVTSAELSSTTGLTVETVSNLSAEVLPGEAVDFFGEANTAFAPDLIVVRVAPGAEIEAPVIITHHLRSDGVAAFPRVHIETGANSSVRVVEVFTSPDIAALVAPVTRISVGQASRVRYQQLQELGPQVWQLGSLIAEVENQATFKGGIAAMGGGYARLRTDCRLVGRGATGDLFALYFGDANQTLDFRTFQDHIGRDTTSNLLFKGVLDDYSKSIYTGLISVAHDAAGTNAFQTNRNIKLSEHAWGESVPNLQIENNDVRCSHASTVSPVDAEQRFYLESRGVPTDAAERLIVEGFFGEVIAQLPVAEVGPHVAAMVQSKIDKGVAQ